MNNDGLILINSVYYKPLEYDMFFFEIHECKLYGSYTIYLKLQVVYDYMFNKREIPCRKRILQEIKRFLLNNNEYIGNIDKLYNTVSNLKHPSYDAFRDKKSFEFFDYICYKTRDVVFNYQLENVEWMLSMEKNKTQVKINKRFRCIYKDMYYDIDNNVLIINPFINYTRQELKTGCLMDSMGTGKTLSVLLLIQVSNRGKPNLIVTDNHLCSQWAGEIQKYTELSFLIISSKKQFESMTMEKIQNTDIIIISYEFLKNKIFKHRISNYEEKTHDNYTFHINKMFDEIQLEPGDTSVPFNVVEWKRVILDECHSVYKHNLVNYINCLRNEFVWLVSGTPFSDDYQFKHHLGLFSCEYKDVVKEIHQWMWRKNSIDSISNEIGFPKIIYETELLTFSQTERDIYDSLSLNISNKYYFEEELRRICCFPNLSKQLNNIIKTFDNIDDIKRSLMNSNKVDLDKIQSVLHQKKRNLQILESIEIASENSEGGGSRNTVSIRIIKNEILAIEKNFENCKKRSQFLSNTEIETVFRCPFCLDHKENPVVTTCGHTYCEECCIQMINSIHSCGICRHPLTESNMVKLKNTPGITSDNVKKYGTKISAIIDYISSMVTEKIIIFSEWDELLVKLNPILRENGIKTFSCRGSIFQKNKSIKSFKDYTKGCVILLSTSNSANGINLTCSNNIIFLEPSENSKDIEKQATARTNRLGQTKNTIVKHFIIKDTIEHRIYVRNQSKL